MISAQWLLERRVPELMPPAQQQNHQHLHAHLERHRLTPAEQQKIERGDKIIAPLEVKEKAVESCPPILLITSPSAAFCMSTR